MDKLRRMFLNHRATLFLAVLLSLVAAFPQVYFRFDHRDIYQGIELLPDSPWSARAREVQDGHPGFGSIYYKDGKDNPYLLPPLGPIAVGYLGAIFNFDINNTLLLSRLVLSFLVFLLIYAFVWLVSKDRLAALSAAALLLFADSVVTFSGLSRLFHGLSPDNFLRLSRPVNPAMVYLPFFAFLILFWLFYKKRDWRYGIASAIVLGLNFYNYFYTWTFLYAFGALLILFFLVQKNWREAFRLTSVFLGALVVAVPYGLNLYRASLHPAYGEISARYGMVGSHAPIFVGFTAIVALLVFFLCFPKEDKERYLFGLALMLTPFITHNQQILTGKILQVDHYHWFFNKPMAVIFMLVVVFYWLGRLPSGVYRKTLAIVIIGASVFTGIFVQVVSYTHDGRDGGVIAIERQRYGPVMDWLNANAEKEAVVLANDEISHLTVIYTSLNVFYHRVAMISLSATKARLLDVFLTFYRLRNIEIDEARKVFFAERGSLSANVYGIYYRELLGSYEAIPDAQVEEALALYQRALTVPAAVWLEQMFKKYEVQYVVWDKKSDPNWGLDRYPFLKEVAVFGDLSIYQR